MWGPQLNEQSSNMSSMQSSKLAEFAHGLLALQRDIKPADECGLLLQLSRATYLQYFYATHRLTIEQEFWSRFLRLHRLHLKHLRSHHLICRAFCRDSIFKSDLSSCRSPDCFNCVIHHCQSLWKSTDTDHSFLLSYAKHCRTHNLQRTTCWGWRWFICTRLVLVVTQSCWVVMLGNNNPWGEFTDGCHTRSAMLERWRLAYE